jgi:dolichol kinase
MLKSLALVSASETRDLKRSVLSIGRSTPHIGRKFYHFMMGVFCFSLYAFWLTREQALFLLSTVGGAWMIGDVLRLKFPAMNAVALKYFGKIMRREELKSITGNSFYILGLLVLVFFFSKPIALLSTLFLAVGDPIAAVVGTHWGRHRLIGKKSVEGALANYIATGFISGLFAMGILELQGAQVIFFALLGGTISTVVELIPTPLDDNFTIPIGSAIFLTLASSLFPFLAIL